MYITPIYTINITQSIYMYIAPIYTPKNACMQHPYTPSIYMYATPLCTINIHVHSTHIHNQHKYT